MEFDDVVTQGVNTDGLKLTAVLSTTIVFVDTAVAARIVGWQVFFYLRLESSLRSLLFLGRLLRYEVKVILSHGSDGKQSCKQEQRNQLFHLFFSFFYSLCCRFYCLYKVSASHVYALITKIIRITSTFVIVLPSLFLSVIILFL